MARDLVQACNDEDFQRLAQLLASHDTLAHVNDLVHRSEIKKKRADWCSNITALNYACEYNTEDYTRLLLDNGAEDDIEDAYGYCAIHRACVSDIDSLLKVQFLVKNDPNNVHLKTREYWTPLMCASHTGHNNVVTFLLSRGADVAPVDVWGQSALHEAVARREHRVIASLLQHGACPNTRDILSVTPVHTASKNADFETVKLLTAAPDCDLTIKTRVNSFIYKTVNFDFRFTKSMTFQQTHPYD